MDVSSVNKKDIDAIKKKKKKTDTKIVFAEYHTEIYQDGDEQEGSDDESIASQTAQQPVQEPPKKKEKGGFLNVNSSLGYLIVFLVAILQIIEKGKRNCKYYYSTSSWNGGIECRWS